MVDLRRGIPGHEDAVVLQQQDLRQAACASLVAGHGLPAEAGQHIARPAEGDPQDRVPKQAAAGRLPFPAAGQAVDQGRMYVEHQPLGKQVVQGGLHAGPAGLPGQGPGGHHRLQEGSLPGRVLRRIALCHGCVQLMPVDGHKARFIHGSQLHAGALDVHPVGVLGRGVAAAGQHRLRVASIAPG